MEGTSLRAAEKAQSAQLWHVNKPCDQWRDGCKMSLCNPEKNERFMVVEQDVGYQRISHCGHEKIKSEGFVMALSLLLRVPEGWSLTNDLSCCYNVQVKCKFHLFSLGGKTKQAASLF